MELRELEQTLETTLAVTRPSARELRDGLVDYFSVVARPFIMKGLLFTDPKADDAAIRRIMLVRLGKLWHNLESPWDHPTVDDLRVFRRRIERYACIRSETQAVRVCDLLDQLFLSASVAERLEAARTRRPARKFQLIQGGGNLSAPTGHLQLVREEHRT